MGRQMDRRKTAGQEEEAAARLPLSSAPCLLSASRHPLNRTTSSSLLPLLQDWASMIVCDDNALGLYEGPSSPSEGCCPCLHPLLSCPVVYASFSHHPRPMHCCCCPPPPHRLTTVLPTPTPALLLLRPSLRTLGLPHLLLAPQRRTLPAATPVAAALHFTTPHATCASRFLHYAPPTGQRWLQHVLPAMRRCVAGGPGGRLGGGGWDSSSRAPATATVCMAWWDRGGAAGGMGQGQSPWQEATKHGKRGACASSG